MPIQFSKIPHPRDEAITHLTVTFLSEYRNISLFGNFVNHFLVILLMHIVYYATVNQALLQCINEAIIHIYKGFDAIGVFYAFSLFYYLCLF